MRYRSTIALSAAALATLALVSACGSDATEPDEVANVRVVNASASTAALNAFNEGRVVVTGLNFQNTNGASGCSTVEHGSNEKVEFTSGSSSTNIGTVEFNFQSQANYTVVFYGTNNATVYPDVFTAPAAGFQAIRFINATGSAGDIYLTTPTATIAGSPTVAALAAGQASGFNSTSAPGGTFVSYPTANTRVRLFNVGVQTGTPRSDFVITTLPANRVLTVVLTPAPSGGTATAFMVSTCAS